MTLEAAEAATEAATDLTAGQSADTAPASEESGGFLSGGDQSGTAGESQGKEGGFLSGDQGGQQGGNDGEGQGDASQAPEGYIKVPGEDASDEERAAFNKAMGIPESAEGYEINLPEEFTEGRDEYLSAIQKTAAAAGLTPQQAQKLAEYDLQAKEEAFEAMQAEEKAYREQQIKDTTADLEKEWGKKATENIRIANRALSQFGGNELKGKLEQAGVLNDPVVIKAFHQAGLSLVEDSSPGGDDASPANKPLHDRMWGNSTNQQS